MTERKSNGLELNLTDDVFGRDLENSSKVLSCPDKKVAIFGGTQIPVGTEYYEKAVTLARKLGDAGMSIITGGGPGIMEAGNKGARESGVNSHGLLVNCISNERCNPFVDSDYKRNFDTLSIRLLTLISCCNAVVFFPGGYGTLEEFSSLAVRLRLGMLEKMPVYLYGSEFWNGLFSWLSGSVLEKGLIGKQDVDSFSILDDIDGIVEGITTFIRGNF